MSPVAEICAGMPEARHIPVMTAEACALLCERAPLTLIDATVGAGGHAAALLRASEARLLGLDRDPSALALAQQRLAEFGPRATLRRANFARLGEVAAEAGFARVAAILADLGLSSFALSDPERGFSFRNDGPLDMRTDPDQKLCAAQVVNTWSEQELKRIILDYGEDRAAGRIARAIVARRRRDEIRTTRELRRLIGQALGRRRPARIDPATRTFQALRIAVNDELENLGAFLAQAPSLLAPHGRMVVIAYHSLEDRMVKRCFRDLAAEGDYRLLTARVLRPARAEVVGNPRARSARLRCLERTG